MEPRVAQRRKNVSEDRARRRLRWILVVIAVVAVIFSAVWLIRSPMLSIRSVEVAGAVQSDPWSALRSLDMDIGTPTIDVDRHAIAFVVLKDPWVASVVVEVVWPGTVVIDVVERTPAALVLTGGRWMLTALDGVVIKEVVDPPTGDAVVVIEQGSLGSGDRIADQNVLAALTFLQHLREESRAGARVFVEGDGLAAVVAGHDVRLGRPVDMAEKAVVLDALLKAGLEEGASIDLIAPSRPAVTNPQPEQEVEE